MTTTTDNTTTSVDRICDYIASKVTSFTWEFHGASIRSFVEKELVASSPDIKTCEKSMRDYNHGKWVDLETLISQGQSITNADFHNRAKVTPAAMQDVIGVDSTGVISDVRQFGRALTADEVESMSQWRSGDDPPDSNRTVVAVVNGKEVNAFFLRCRRTWFPLLGTAEFEVGHVTEWRELTESERQ